MHLVGHFSLFFAMLASVVLAGLGLSGAWSGKGGFAAACEKGHLAATLLMTLACSVLLQALLARDFSLEYVARYTDTLLPVFYTVTAFWAGQAGSLLFWAWTVALCGAIFQFTPAYAALRPQAKSWYWLLFFSVQAFFLLLLTGPANPFMELSPAPAEGTGLNPLLRNPGMIFHPPLLFFGYAGFTVPACLALASFASGEPEPWLPAARRWTLASWAFLTAGIVLGGWWSYMELGWGGYWAWDPVENASLIPWLSATAFIHTALVQERRAALHRSNVFLLCLTLILCFFATFLVRSGVVESLHAFGSGGMGTPLGLAMLLMLAVSVAVPRAVAGPASRPLSSLFSRQGFLVLAAWMLLAIGMVVLLGTMWPVLSKLWSDKPIGLDAGFYNKVCLPLFTLLALLLAACPWLGWREGLRHPRAFWAVAGVFLGAGAMFWAGGVRDFWPLLAAASAAAIVAGALAVFWAEPALRRLPASWGAFGTHLGLALLVLGVAFSGPYKTEVEASLKKGDSLQLGAYSLTYADFSETQDRAMAAFAARITVSRAGQPLGELTPERRVYRGFEQPFAEVSTIFSLKDEIYATVLSFDRERTISVKLSVNPLVNWIWIGGTVMCLLPFVGMRRRAGGA